MQRFLPTYRPWPPPIVLHLYLASSAPQLHPRRALSPLTTAIGQPNIRWPTPQVRSSPNRLSAVSCTSHSTPRRSEPHAWLDMVKILIGEIRPFSCVSLISPFVLL